MRQIIVSVVVGFLIGVLTLAFMSRNGASGGSPDFSEMAPASLVDSRAGLAALRADMDSRFARLEQQLTDLVAAMESHHASASVDVGNLNTAASSATSGDVRAELEEQRRQIAAHRDRLRLASGSSNDDRLLEAGFPPERIHWINRRIEELRMEAMQKRYAAQQSGEPPGPNGVRAMLAPELALRAEMGDAEYERYLEALGRPTSAPVDHVLASSPAEQAGLRTGDEIVSYDGRRVFSQRELDALAYENGTGESVLIEVRRDGQTMQIVVPRGPLGVSGDALDSLLRITR